MTPVDLDGQSPERAIDDLAAAGRLHRLAGLGGGKVAWRAWGQGQALILLHGGYGSWAHWVRVVQPLSERFHVLVPDMPGFGQSDDPPVLTSEKIIAESLWVSVQALIGAHEHAIIGGFSFGGVIAGHLAGHMGERCDHLILVAPGGLGVPRGEMPELIRRTRDMSAMEIQNAHRRNLEILMFADHSLIDPLALFIQTRNTAKHRVKSRPISATDTLARALEALPTRVHALYGSEDATVGRYMPEREHALKRACPDVQIHVTPGAGHWLMYERPEAFIGYIHKLIETDGHRR